MDGILEQVKSRIRQPGSPIRTVKAVAEAIEMSESGFYKMLERGTYRVPTLIALSRALDLDDNFFLPEISQKSSKQEIVEPTELGAILSELKILREQLQVKDRQIELKDAQISGLLKAVDTLAGKYEGADLDQLFQPTGDVEVDLETYKAGTVAKTILPMLKDIFLPLQVAK